MINPDGVRHQIHGNVIQSTSRALMEEVSFDRTSVTAREWGAYPIITFPDVPKIDVLMLPRQDQPPLGVGESASVPSAAAIANAIFDATGVRFRELPFTPERILAGIARRAVDRTEALPAPASRRSPPRHHGKIRSPDGAACSRPPPRSAPPRSASAPPCCRGGRSRRSRGRMRRSIRPRPSRAASNSPRSAIARSATPSANGILNAGGRPLQTPFGTIYSTNITPDVETGIGAWSYPAFERAMREGIHRDGRHLYPAFPYTAFRQDDRRRPAGALRLSDGAAAGARRDPGERAGISVQPAPADGGMECAVPSGRACSSPIPRNPSSGIAAPIWSKASAIAAPAIRRATRSARRGATPISPAALPKAGRRRR